MSQQNQEFDIQKLLELARYNKYETTVAGFSALDKIEKINIPKKLKTRKTAVQALHALSEKLVQYGYFNAEQRKEVSDKLNSSDVRVSGFKGLFSNSQTSAAPKVEEDTEEEFIPEEAAAVAESSSDDEDEESDNFDEEDDFEEDEEEEKIEDEEEER